MMYLGESPELPTPASAECGEDAAGQDGPQFDDPHGSPPDCAGEALTRNTPGDAAASREDLLPIVGLGGSAGGIQALREFFSEMPADSGLAFVVVLHLSPEHESTLADLLQRVTAMPVVQARDDVKVEANHVYIIAPGKYLESTDGHLRLTPLQPERGKRMTIDVFFRTLAETHGSQAVAIVLSGADGDGAMGLQRIKERGGLTIAQDPDESEHSMMPRSAIDTGMVDWVLPIREMPPRLLAYLQRAARMTLPPEEVPPVVDPAADPAAPAHEDGETALRNVLLHLRTRTGRDFSYYKRATVLRRVARRMQVNSVDNLLEYLAFLRTHPGEAGALLQDLLISVTNFFRDPEAFKVLQAYIPELFRGKGPQDTVRVWCVACATGEEAYSMAMLLTEHADTLGSPPLIQVFATDLDEIVIHTARDGLYTEAIATDVSEERLRRFFVKEQHGYRVRRELREVVLFARHDLLKDSPFSRLNLLSCRNLLIYLNHDAQKRALEIFHFALNPEGQLLLGSAETVDGAGNLFAALDKKHRFYARRPAPRMMLPMPIGQSTSARSLQEVERAGERPALPPLPGLAPGVESPDWLRAELSAEGEPAALGGLHQRIMEELGPASLIVDSQQDIVHLSQAADRFLQFGTGQLTRSLLRAAHPMLRIPLRVVLYRAAQTRQPAEMLDVPIDLDGHRQSVDLHVSPAHRFAPDHFLVVLQSRPVPSSAEGVLPASNADLALRQLEQELEALKAHLRNVEEQHDVVTEEHKAGNEELQAMNEELRSASEELETSREELQSINEELMTVNQELKGKVDELGHAYSDMQNLMDATAIATVFLDRELCITRYTPAATSLFNLIETDIGRPLAHLRHRLDYPELEQDAARVLRQLAPVEREIGNTGSGCFLVRLLPYRTLDDRIAGVVLACVEITATRRVEEAKVFLAAIVESSEESIISIDFNRVITSWNSAAERLYGYSAADAIGKPMTMLTLPADLADILRRAEAIEHSESVESSNTVRVHKNGHEMWLSVVMSPVKDKTGKVIGISTIARDITARRRAELALRESEARYQRIAANVPGMVYQFVLRTDGTVAIPFVSVGCREIYGFGAEEIQADARLVMDMTHSEDRPEYDRSIKESAATLQPWLWLGRIVRPGTGEIRFLQAASRPEKQPNGDIAWDGVVMDVTDRQQADEHRRAKEEAERTNEAKNEFLSRMSHELRTPLNAILGFGQILQLKTRDEEDALALEHILKGGRHLLSLVDEVLDLSRAESGELHLLIQDIAADKITQECVDLVGRLAQAHGVTCEVNIVALQAAAVQADEQRLRQILLNLLSNAIKYNRRDGRVIVGGSEVSLGKLRLTVTDTGPGISADGIARLFMPFERLNQEHKDIEGTGLGLVISRQIAEAMGGTVGVESKVGVGSTFWVELPLAKVRATPVAAAAAVSVVEFETAPEPALHGAKVLYIEDNASNLQVVRMLLERSRPDWQFLSARDGKSGLEQIRQLSPDLVLLDLQLPGMPGDAVLAELRRNPATRKTPVIVLSADATVHSREQLLAGGADEYLSKPFQLKQLLALLDRLLPKAGVGGGAE